MKPPTLPRWGQEATDAIREVFAGDLAGLYLYGSMLDGGNHTGRDLDVLAILAAPVEAVVYREIARRLLLVSSWNPRTRTGNPIELTVVALPDLIPWRYPPRKQFQFGEWLRPELEDGHIERPSDDPDLAILLTMARSRSIALFGPCMARLIDPVPESDIRRAIAEMLPRVIHGLPGDERNVILTLARMWVTLSSGEIVSKDEAASRMLPNVAPTQRPTLDAARRAYLGEIDDDWRVHQDAARVFAEYADHEIRKLISAAGVGLPES